MLKMKMNLNLYDILLTKGIEVNNKIESFLLNIIELKERSYNDHGVILSKGSSAISMAWDYENGSVNSFSIRVKGWNLKEEYEYSTNFFGKEIMKKVYRERYEECMCFPFIINNYQASFERNSFSGGYKGIEIDYEEFLDKVNSLNFKDLDNDTLYKIQIFIQTVLVEIEQSASTIDDELTDELASLDINNDGKADILDSSDFMKLLQKNQVSIIGVDRNYLHKFIKLNNNLKSRENNIHSIFDKILNEKRISDKLEILGLLKNEIHIYELVLFHSINMVVSLGSNNLIEFYEIYEKLDKLNIFNSNWENDISNKLETIGDKLDDLMHLMHRNGQDIIGELKQLNYVSSESFKSLNMQVSNQLNEINSSINVNSLLTGIQAYQLFKIRKEAKF